MSEIKFTCPRCKQSLEGDDTMRGLVIECPSCKTPITVPPLHKKQIVLSKPGQSAPLTAFVPTPKTSTSKFGIVIALILGLLIGAAVGYSVGTKMAEERVEASPFH